MIIALRIYEFFVQIVIVCNQHIEEKIKNAGVAKSVDAQHLKCCDRKVIWVQVPFPAQGKIPSASAVGILRFAELAWVGLEARLS